MGHAPAGVSKYDSIARLYDPWSVSVTEDVEFYVEEAQKAGSPVVELGVGTGRIAVPTAAAGIRVIGVDSSPGMLEVCREAAELAGVAGLLDLRLGEVEAPPVDERVGLVTCPFRSFLHLLDDDARLRALRAARELLVPGGRFVFDVFAPSREDIMCYQEGDSGMRARRFMPILAALAVLCPAFTAVAQDQLPAEHPARALGCQLLALDLAHGTFGTHGEDVAFHVALGRWFADPRRVPKKADAAR